MEYEIVTLKERVTVGITATTNNNDPNVGAVIGGLWGTFYKDNIFEKIKEKKTHKTLAIYSDYKGQEQDDYNITVACEVNAIDNVPEGLVAKKIKAGNYAKFVIKGDVQKDVLKFWQELWNMKLDRAFLSDFEEYQDCNMEEAEVHIYIGLK